MARTAQTNATPAAAKTTKPKSPKGTKLFNVENEKLGKLSLTVKLPEVTDDIVASFFDVPNADAAKAVALRKFVAGQQSAKIGTFLRKAEKTSDVTAENALKALEGLKYTARGAAKTVKRSSEDVSKAIAVLGMDVDPEKVKAMLASLGVMVADPTEAAAS